MGPLRGVSEMIAKVKKLQTQFPFVIAAALYAEGQIETTECKKRTPVWNSSRPAPSGVIPGALRASVHLEGPFIEGNRIWVTIVAGGVAGAYAMRQHEELEWFHKDGQAKYIESVINESREYMAARVAARLDITKVAE